MKKIVSLLTVALLLLALIPAKASAAGNAPVIALTYKPIYNETRPFQGVVYTEDGASFDPTDYRISLYLQISENGTYWVKPTYDTPYAEIGADGSFSIRYVTGGVDEQATVLHIMLIPVSHTPDSDFEATRATALDYVKVTRTEDGGITVEPNRSPPPPPPFETMPSPLPVSKDKIAVDVGFYTDGSSPGSALSADLVRQQLNAVSGFADTVRFYGAAGQLAKAYEIAHSMGFRVVGNAWLSGNDAADKAELNALIEHCNNGYVTVAVVGSEALLRGDLSASELIQDITYVRERLNNKKLPVTTADSVDILLEQPSVRNACDILMPNCYPYWNGVDISKAAEYFTNSIDSLKAVSAGKPVVVSETGWPTAGQSGQNADAGETEATRYFTAIRKWSIDTDTQVLFFDAADEPWKTANEGASGAHWGFMTNRFAVKDCYAASVTPGFTDVSPVSNYAKAIQWAVKSGITQGTSVTTFAPDVTCTHNHILTFLWRAGGSPLTNISNPFRNIDVKSDFGKAALWAYEKGLISGDHSGIAPCNRAQAVTFLWKLAGSPAAHGAAFSDVPSNADYRAAVSWAVENGVTNGTTNATFSPERICTRGQIVTFLYRYWAVKDSSF